MMDLQIIKRYSWLILLLLYMGSLSFHVWNNGFESTLLSSLGISLLIASISTLFTYSATIRKWSRMLKHFLGYSTFYWDVRAVFTIRQNKIMFDFASDVKEVFKVVMNDNDIKINPGDISVSKERSGQLNIFIGPLVIHTALKVSDAEQYDKEGYSLSYLDVRLRTSMRYKEMRKLVTGVIIDVFRNLENKFDPQDQKFNVKIRIEDKNKDLLKKQFIKEFKPEEIQHFTITVNNTPKSNQEVTDRQISLNTNRREDLIEAVKNILLRLS